MMIDPAYFGYGAGVVLLGWLCGAALGAIIGALRAGSGAP